MVISTLFRIWLEKINSFKDFFGFHYKHSESIIQKYVTNKQIIDFFQNEVCDQVFSKNSPYFMNWRDAKCKKNTFSSLFTPFGINLMKPLENRSKKTPFFKEREEEARMEIISCDFDRESKNYILRLFISPGAMYYLSRDPARQLIFTQFTNYHQQRQSIHKSYDPSPPVIFANPKIYCKFNIIIHYIKSLIYFSYSS
jgi:hypothetical protein